MYHWNPWPGLDYGGVSREFFELLCVECFDTTSGLFKRFKDSPQALVSLTMYPEGVVQVCQHLSIISIWKLLHMINGKHF